MSTYNQNRSLKTFKVLSIAFMVILLLLALMTIVGCKFNEDARQDDPNEVLNGRYVVVIDSCEYIVSGSGYSTTMTHKGNCKNPIHIYNKQNGQ